MTLRIRPLNSFGGKGVATGTGCLRQTLNKMSELVVKCPCQFCHGKNVSLYTRHEHSKRFRPKSEISVPMQVSNLYNSSASNSMSGGIGF